MSNINEWLSVDMMEGEGNYNVTLTASAYNGANNRTTRIAVIGNNKTKYVNIIQLKKGEGGGEGDVETPTDVKNCFYVEPVNVGDELTITLSCTKYSDENIGVQYYEEGEWKTGYLLIEQNEFGNDIYRYTKKIYKRTYFKEYKNYNSPAEETGKNFNIKGLCNIGGDIQTLRNNCNGLFSRSDIVDSSNLILSNKNITYEHYFGMFQNCTSLVNAPELPATTLADRCYMGMFAGCTSLVTAPELPATTLEDSCYWGMFSGCTSLVNAPELPADIIPEYAYYYMFADCTSLVNAPALPATRLSTFAGSSVYGGNSYSYMFKGCTSLVNAPELPATILADWCYQGMFKGCTSLVNAPTTLPVTTFYIEFNDYGEHLFQNTYESMFEGCTSLVNAPALPATTLGIDCYSYMFKGCTSLVNAPELPATTLEDRCYYEMFNGCTSLNNITMLATDISARNCFRNWVQGVSNIGVFYKNPNMNDLPTGDSGIPEGWEVRDYEI